MTQPFTLVCFAMKDEARPFLHRAKPEMRVQTLITGVGHKNAERSIRAAVAKARPESVLTCGFAGGLAPSLATGTIVFAADDDSPLKSRLLAAGARPTTFHCSREIATNAEEKRSLRQSTGADAVEMESVIIHSVCREQKVPCATLRIILDTAEQDLPLDFNRLTTADQQLHYGKLAMAILRSPQTIPALLQLQKQTQSAANILADFLLRITAQTGQ